MSLLVIVVILAGGYIAYYWIFNLATTTLSGSGADHSSCRR